MRAELTDRQCEFLHFFLDGALTGPGRTRYNASRSAAAAGYAWPYKQGPRLLQHPLVAGALDLTLRVRTAVPRPPR